MLYEVITPRDRNRAGPDRDNRPLVRGHTARPGNASAGDRQGQGPGPGRDLAGHTGGRGAALQRHGRRVSRGV